MIFAKKTVSLLISILLSLSLWSAQTTHQIYDESASLQLIDAISSRNFDVALALIEKPAVDVNILNTYGHTPLIDAAAVVGGLEIITALLKHRDINVNKQNDSGFTALLGALAAGETAKAKAILAHKHFNKEAVNTKSYWYLSFGPKHPEILKLIEDHIRS